MYFDPCDSQACEHEPDQLLLPATLTKDEYETSF
jgi:hypothetical protein